ncbi:MAG: hypothetical protein M3Q98_05505 [Actinomycetota bacterium]|nr:hypothetical protein [Actinomycetota bacterium]
MSGLDLRPVRNRPRRGEPDLAQLLLLAADGDANAFMRFYDASITSVYLLARACSVDAAAADAVVRSVYDRAWRGCWPRRVGAFATGLAPS